MPLKDFSEVFGDDLRDPEFARGLLQEALEDDDPRLFLLVLRDIAKANNFTQIAKEAGVNRESAYVSLSDKGNPGYLTLRAILQAVGLDLDIRRIEHGKSQAA